MTYNPDRMLCKGKTVTILKWGLGGIDEERISTEFANYLLKKGYEAGWSDGNQC